MISSWQLHWWLAVMEVSLFYVEKHWYQKHILIYVWYFQQQLDLYFSRHPALSVYKTVYCSGTAWIVPGLNFVVRVRDHNHVNKWKHFPRYWSFVRGIHWSPVDSPHKGQWRGTLTFSLITGTNTWAINGDTGDLRRHRAHHDVILIWEYYTLKLQPKLLCVPRIFKPLHWNRNIVSWLNCRHWLHRK